MNVVKRAVEFLERAMPTPAGMSLMDLDRLMDWNYGQPTYTGKIISQSSSLQCSAVWACVQAKAGDLATLPLLPHRRTGKILPSGRFERELATDHYLWNLLTHQANPEMTAYRFKHLMQSWVELWGNAYAEIEMNGRGQVTALWPWHPAKVKVERQADGQIVYWYGKGTPEEMSRPEVLMFHLRGISLDGLTGLSRIEVQRQGIGLSLAMQEHGARFFGNGARPLGVLTHPHRLPKEGGVEEVRKAWEAMHGGLSNSHRVAILQDGMKYEETGLSMVDAQYLEMQNFSVNDIARIFGVPPHRIGALDRATNNNIEELALEYISYTLGPEATNWQNEIAFSLLSQKEASNIFCEFDFRSLMRGDLESQAKFWPAMVQAGIVVPDEAREEIGMNPHAGGIGAKPWMPLNTGFMGDPKPAAPPPAEKTPASAPVPPAKPNGAYKQ